MHNRLIIAKFATYIISTCVSLIFLLYNLRQLGMRNIGLALFAKTL